MPRPTKYPNIPENFHELMKEVRRNKKITQVKMGEDLGVHSVTLSKYEKGEMNISYERAVMIKDYLGLDIELPKPDFSVRRKSRIHADGMTRQINVTMPEEIMDRVREQAEKELRTVANMMYVMAVRYLERLEE
jgi:transcriptional regulator with XRE-family HTH domain